MKNFKVQRDSALIFVVDIQGRLMPAMADPKGVVKNTSTLLHAAKAYALPAVYSEQYPKGLGPTEEEVLKLLEELDAFRLEKTQYNATLPEMMEAIKKTGRKQIILTGTETHVCVYQTVRSLLEAGYELFVPYDAVGSRSEKNRDNALEQFREMGAVVTNTETLLFDLMKDAKDPHFKELQQYIK